MNTLLRQPPLCGLLAALTVAAPFLLPAVSAGARFSLADDFSSTENRSSGIWSYRLDDRASPTPSFPLFGVSNRDANALWGSEFATPPLMWSEAMGYWGIGKNTTGRELFSPRNGTRWAPGEVLLHPKAGPAPAGLAITWTAPSNLVIDVTYVFGRAAEQGDGIGYEIIMRRGPGGDVPVVSLRNIGSSLSNTLTRLIVSRGDQLFFRFNTGAEPGGDITRAEIQIHGASGETPGTVTAATHLPIQPAAGRVLAGSDFTFDLPGVRAGKWQWLRDGQPLPGATKTQLRLSRVQTTDAGVYSVRADGRLQGEARLDVIPAPAVTERYPSSTPRQRFAETLSGQEVELKTNVLMQRFAASRQRLSADPYRPAYHFVSPESQLNDPNGLCYWQGRWHLFYQAYPPDEFPEPKDIARRRQHWGHAVSADLVHWRDLPYAIYPGIERMCFSGSTVVDSNQVVAFYPGIHAGQMVAIARDPLLLNWDKIDGNPVIRGGGDACIWKEGNTYCGLIGRGLWTSTNLTDWTQDGEFYTGVEGSCPNFVPIGDKHLILGFSHAVGGLYLLGDYDLSRRRFKAYHHGRFNHGTVSPGGVHAPSAASDGRGGVINILNINDARHSDDWDQIMSVAQQLTLGPDKRLRLGPVAALALLRTNHQRIAETLLPANQEIVLESVRGNTLELDVEIDPQEARWVQLNVLRSAGGEEQTSITFYNFDRKLSIWYDTGSVISLDGTRSSTRGDVWLRPPERVVAERPRGEPLRLRVFIDRSVVEVFVNERQYLAQRVYPGRPDSLSVSLRAQGQPAILKKLDAWRMRPIWPGSS